MGQRRWARLAIGGALSRDALAGALEEGQVVVEDAEASWGGFSELEAWLEARGIPFDLESGPAPAGGPTGSSTSAPTGGAWSSSPTTAMRSRLSHARRFARR